MKPLRLALAQALAGSLPPLGASLISRWIYPPERGRLDNHSFRVRGCTGSAYCGTTHDKHAHLFAIHGYYDWRILAVATYLCRPGDRIIEVGANVGTETISFADVVGPEGRVYAFEPLQTNLDYLHRVVQAASLSQVEIVPAAVSDRGGTVRFIPPTNSHESGVGHIGAETHHTHAPAVLVECLTLDSFVADKKPIRLIVIDAEGAEVAILKGGRHFLQRDRPVIVVEAQEAHLRRFGFGLADLYSELRAHSYSIFEMIRFGLKEVRLGDTHNTRNWLALPPALANQARKVHRHLVKCGLLPCIRGLSPLTRRPSKCQS